MLDRREDALRGVSGDAILLIENWLSGDKSRIFFVCINDPYRQDANGSTDWSANGFGDDVLF